MLKRTVSLLLAVGFAAFCVNALCFFYYSYPPVVNRTNAATDWIWVPYSRFMNAREGLAWGTFDQNGYYNTEPANNSPTILLMGNSHVEACQLPAGQRMNAILSECFQGDYSVYNIGRAGFQIPSLLRRFPAAIGEFPGSAAIVVYVDSTDYSPAELKETMDQYYFDASETAENLVDQRTLGQKAYAFAKQALPLYQVLQLQFGAEDFSFHNAFGFQADTNQEETEIWDEQEYRSALDDILRLIRSQYDNPIVFSYSPKVDLLSDGSMELIRDAKTYDIFAEVCLKNDIAFLDLGDAFLQAYESDYSVPYGFQNTSMGEGHLNATGHRIAGEQQYRILEGLIEG